MGFAVGWGVIVFISIAGESLSDVTQAEFMFMEVYSRYVVSF